jgi:hypothetical protein
MLPPFWAVEAGFDEILEIHALLFCCDCWIVCRRGNLGIFGFHLLELCRVDKTKALIRPCHRGPQPPGDFFYVFLACQSPVFVERAFANGKMNLAFEIEVPAKNFFLGGAKFLDDVPVAAGPAQRFGTLRCSSFYFDGDHVFLFSKKRFSASDCAPVVRTHRVRTPRTVTRANRKIRATMRHKMGRATLRSFENVPEENRAS